MFKIFPKNVEALSESTYISYSLDKSRKKGLSIAKYLLKQGIKPTKYEADRMKELEMKVTRPSKVLRINVGLNKTHKFDTIDEEPDDDVLPNTSPELANLATVRHDNELETDNSDESDISDDSNKIIDKMITTKKDEETDRELFYYQIEMKRESILSPSDIPDDDEPDDTCLRNRCCEYGLQTLYPWIVEALATADFATDVFVLISLFRVSKQLWASIMLMSMLAPYLVAYTAFNSLFQYETTTKKGQKRCKNLVGLLLLTPLSIALYVIIDITVMVVSSISIVLWIITCQKCKPIDISHYTIEKWFKLNTMQLSGYRRCRTLSQLVFETCIQLCLQIRIFIQTSRDGDDDLESLNIDGVSLGISVLFAIFHLFFELCVLWIESRAAKMNIAQYGIICLSGRLDWVPYSQQLKTYSDKNVNSYDFLESLDVDDQTETNESKINAINRGHQVTQSLLQNNIAFSPAILSRNKSYRLNLFAKANQVDSKHVFNYEKIETSSRLLCGKKYSMHFQFSSETLLKFGEILSSITYSKLLVKNNSPRYYLQLNRPIIKLGEKSTKSMDLIALYDLYKSARGRAYIDWSEVDFKRLLINSRRNEMERSLERLLNSDRKRRDIRNIKTTNSEEKALVSVDNMFHQESKEPDNPILVEKIQEFFDDVIIKIGDYNTCKFLLKNVVSDVFANENKYIAIKVMDTGLYRPMMKYRKNGLLYQTNEVMLKFLARKFCGLVKRSDLTRDIVIDARLFVWSAGGFYLTYGNKDDDGNIKTIADYCCEYARKHIKDKQLEQFITDFFHDAVNAKITLEFEGNVNSKLEIEWEYAELFYNLRKCITENDPELLGEDTDQNPTYNTNISLLSNDESISRKNSHYRSQSNGIWTKALNQGKIFSDNKNSEEQSHSRHITVKIRDITDQIKLKGEQLQFNIEKTAFNQLIDILRDGTVNENVNLNIMDKYVWILEMDNMFNHYVKSTMKFRRKIQEKLEIKKKNLKRQSIKKNFKAQNLLGGDVQIKMEELYVKEYYYWQTVVPPDAQYSKTIRRGNETDVQKITLPLDKLRIYGIRQIKIVLSISGVKDHDDDEYDDLNDPLSQMYDYTSMSEDNDATGNAGDRRALLDQIKRSALKPKKMLAKQNMGDVFSVYLGDEYWNEYYVASASLKWKEVPLVDQLNRNPKAIVQLKASIDNENLPQFKPYNIKNIAFEFKLLDDQTFCELKNVKFHFMSYLIKFYGCPDEGMCNIMRDGKDIADCDVANACSSKNIAQQINGVFRQQVSKIDLAMDGNVTTKQIDIIEPSKNGEPRVKPFEMITAQKQSLVVAISDVQDSLLTNDQFGVDIKIPAPKAPDNTLDDIPNIPKQGSIALNYSESKDDYRVDSPRMMRKTTMDAMGMIHPKLLKDAKIQVGGSHKPKNVNDAVVNAEIELDLNLEESKTHNYKNVLLCGLQRSGCNEIFKILDHSNANDHSNTNDKIIRDKKKKHIEQFKAIILTGLFRLLDTMIENKLFNEQHNDYQEIQKYYPIIYKSKKEEDILRSNLKDGFTVKNENFKAYKLALKQLWKTNIVQTAWKTRYQRHLIKNDVSDYTKYFFDNFDKIMNSNDLSIKEICRLTPIIQATLIEASFFFIQKTPYKITKMLSYLNNKQNSQQQTDLNLFSRSIDDPNGIIYCVPLSCYCEEIIFENKDHNQKPPNMMIQCLKFFDEIIKKWRNSIMDKSINTVVCVLFTHLKLFRKRIESDIGLEVCFNDTNNEIIGVSKWDKNAFENEFKQIHGPNILEMVEIERKQQSNKIIPNHDVRNTEILNNDETLIMNDNDNDNMDPGNDEPEMSEINTPTPNELNKQTSLDVSVLRAPSHDTRISMSSLQDEEESKYQSTVDIGFMSDDDDIKEDIPQNDTLYNDNDSNIDNDSESSTNNDMSISKSETSKALNKYYDEYERRASTHIKKEFDRIANNNNINIIKFDVEQTSKSSVNDKFWFIHEALRNDRFKARKTNLFFKRSTIL